MIASAVALKAGAGMLALGSVVGGGALTSTAPAAATATSVTVVKQVTRQVTVNHLAVRTGPSTAYRRVAWVDTGFSFSGQLLSNNWVKVTSGKYAGRYVAGWFTKDVTSPKPPTGQSVSGVVWGSDYKVAVRSGASTTSSVVAWLAPGTRVSGTKTGSDWVRVGAGYLNLGTVNTTGLANRAVNGAVPGTRLCPIPTYMNSAASFAPAYTPATVRYANCQVRNALVAMDAAYTQRFGKHLKVDLAYRTFAEQKYWLSKLGYPAAAIPGTSNHGWGTAIDFAESSSSPFRFGQAGDTWLTANGARFGFDRPSFMDRGGVNPEYWHYNFTG